MWIKFFSQHVAVVCGNIGRVGKKEVGKSYGKGDLLTRFVVPILFGFSEIIEKIRNKSRREMLEICIDQLFIQGILNKGFKNNIFF